MEKIRRYELVFMVGAAMAYIIRRLFEVSAEFDTDIRIALSSNVPTSTLLKDLVAFDYNLNVIFPTAVGGLLFMMAWYVFHYLAFPRIKNRIVDNQTISWIALTILLVVSSIFIYSYFRLEWRWRYNGDHLIVGMKVYSLFRKLHLLTNTFAALFILLVYEAIAQVYYYTLQLYEEKRQPKHQTLSYIIATGVVATVIFWVFVGRIANLILGRNGVVASLIIITFTVVLHQFFFKKAIPFLAKFRLQTMEGFMHVFAYISAYGLVSFVLIVGWFMISSGRDDLVIIYFVIPNIAGLLTALIRWYFFVENQQLQTQVLRQSAELSTLRSQINPHFLFNALNTLYSVAMKENSEKTADGIQKLGDMMRFMLHENNQERIPLSKELEYLQNFLDIQRMRIDESQSIEIRVNLQEAKPEVYIAPMLLNPFVENAFKHGISFRNPSWIYITLTQDATKLYFKVHNSVHAKSAEDPEREHSGIGLENVRKRLELLYPNRHTLDIQATEQDFFVSLILGIY
ncbi:MAG: histidine kinase [Spirosomataceae bacterium]